MYMIVEVSQYVVVAFFTEAWIEIVIAHCLKLPAFVASFSEAWIEINVQISIKPSNESPPSWRRGLKYRGI